MKTQLKKGLRIASLLLFILTLSINANAKGRRYNTSHKTSIARHQKIKTSFRTYSRINYRGNSIYYSSGKYYNQSPTGYIVLEKIPQGITVSELPEDTELVVIGKKTYYRYDNVYYKKVWKGYKVVVV